MEVRQQCSVKRGGRIVWWYSLAEGYYPDLVFHNEPYGECKPLLCCIDCVMILMQHCISVNLSVRDRELPAQCVL